MMRKNLTSLIFGQNQIAMFKVFPFLKRGNFVLLDSETEKDKQYRSAYCF